MTTWPWSSSVSVPSSSVTGTCATGARRARRGRGPALRLGVAVAAVAGGDAGRVAGRGRNSRGVALAAVGRPAASSGLGLDVVAERLAELLVGDGQRHAVLRALRAGERGHDVAEVELERVGERRVLGVLVVPEALLLGVGLDEVDLLLRPAREQQVAQRLLVDREDRAGRAELRAHVADRRPVGEREVRQAVPVELDELADDPLLAEQLRDGEDEVGRGRTLGQLAVQLEADDLRDEHRHRLAEHGRLRLDAADAPAEDAEPVDHRGVRVGPDERVGVGDAVLLVDEHDAAQVLEVHLVDDARLRRHDLEVVEGVLAPAEELVALAVAFVLLLGVEAERGLRAVRVDLDGVVDDQLRRDEGVDAGRIAAEVGHRVAHGGEVDDRGHAGEVLHDHAGGGEGDLLAGLRVRVPGRQRLDVLLRDGAVAFGAEEVLEQDLEAEGQAGDVVGGLQGVESEDVEFTVADAQLGAGVEAVVGHAPDVTSGGSPTRRRRSRVWSS